MKTKKKNEPPSSFLRIKFALQIVYNQKYKISIGWFPELSFISQRLKLIFVICIWVWLLWRDSDTIHISIDWFTAFSLLAR